MRVCVCSELSTLLRSLGLTLSTTLVVQVAQLLTPDVLDDARLTLVESDEQKHEAWEVRAVALGRVLKCCVVYHCPVAVIM